MFGTLFDISALRKGLQGCLSQSVFPHCAVNLDISDPLTFSLFIKFLFYYQMESLHAKVFCVVCSLVLVLISAALLEDGVLGRLPSLAVGVGVS